MTPQRRMSPQPTMNPEIPRDRKEAMAYFAAKRDEAIANGMRTYSTEEINRARQVGWEEVDAVRDNLERLAHLVPGSVVRLKSGEEYVMDQHGWWQDSPCSDGWPQDHWGEYLDHGYALPLLKAAVEAGAQVCNPGDES